METLEEILTISKKNKAIGTDKLPDSFFKSLLNKNANNKETVKEIKERLINFLNDIKDGKCTIPSYLKEGRMLLLSKSNSEIVKINNSSMIIMNNALMKIVEFKWLCKVIENEQFGFRPGTSVQSAIIYVKQLIEYIEANSERAVIIKLDLSKAYDSVNRFKVLKILNKYITKQSWNMYKQLMLDTKIKVIEKLINTNSRAPQGSILSPVVFAVYLQAATEALKSYVHANEGNIIYYADDMIILIRRNKVEAMKKVINDIREEWNVQINLEKSDYILIGKGAKKDTIEGIGNKVTTMRYLGVSISGKIGKLAMKRLKDYTTTRTNALQKKIYFR